MKLIFLNNSGVKPFTLSFDRYLYAAIAFAVLAILGFAIYIGFLLGRPDPSLMAYHERVSAYSLSSEVLQEKENIEKTRKYVERNLEALNARVGLLQAQVSRINAVEKRLARAAKVDLSSFDFDSNPAIGGGELESEIDGEVLSAEIESLESILSKREAAIQSLGVSMVGEVILFQARSNFIKEWIFRANTELTLFLSQMALLLDLKMQAYLVILWKLIMVMG